MYLLDVQTANAATRSSQSPAKNTPYAVSRAERLTTFRQAIASGCTIVEAARATGVSERTAARWKAAVEGEVVNIKDAVAAIAQKTEAATILTAIARDEKESAAYRVAALDKLGRWMGYESAIRTESLVIHASVAQHLEAKRLELAAAQPAHAKRLEPGEPPNEKPAESSSLTQTTAKNLPIESKKEGE